MFRDPDIGKPAQQLREERYKRLRAAMAVGVPDRVPINCYIGYFPGKFARVPCSAAYYDFDAWYDAYEKALKEFRPDIFGEINFQSGKAMEMLGLKFMRWPGYGVDPYHGHQAIEIESLKAKEFDIYMHDSNDYMLRLHLPRISDKLDGLGKMPPLYQVLHGPVSAMVAAMVVSDPEVARAIAVLQKSGREMRRAQAKQAKFQKLMERYGYYAAPMVGAMPPFDTISHSLRGMTGTMYDMFRQPDKLIELCEFVLKETLVKTPLIPDENGDIKIFMTNTRGSDDFLSKEQFDRFYWPTFKKLVIGLCERGATPHIFFEGNCDSRMEYLLEFPRGKFVVRLDRSDIFRAKEILKGHCCLEGNVPSSLLGVGSKEDVIAYCRKLIDVVGKGGGFIISPRSAIDEANPENLKAMIDFTKEYGRYR